MKCPKCTIFGIFNEILSTQKSNVARFARNVEWDVFCGFQTPWMQRIVIIYLETRSLSSLLFAGQKVDYFGVWQKMMFSMKYGICGMLCVCSGAYLICTFIDMTIDAFRTFLVWSFNLFKKVPNTILKSFLKKQYDWAFTPFNNYAVICVKRHH